MCDVRFPLVFPQILGKIATSLYKIIGGVSQIIICLLGSGTQTTLNLTYVD